MVCISIHSMVHNIYNTQARLWCAFTTPSMAIAYASSSHKPTVMQLLTLDPKGKLIVVYTGANSPSAAEGRYSRNRQTTRFHHSDTPVNINYTLTPMGGVALTVPLPIDLLSGKPPGEAPAPFVVGP